MSFESQKFKIVIGEKREEHPTPKEKIEKKLREVAAWGFITLSSFGIIKALVPEKPKEGMSLDQIVSAYIDKDKKLKSAEKQELYKKIDYLKQQFGKLTIWQLNYFSEIDVDTKSKNPQISGFNKLHPKLDDKIFKNIWNEKYYPKGWINERVKEIEYVEKEDLVPAIPDRYGQDAKMWKMVAQYSSLDIKKAKVEFFRPTGSLSEDASAQQIVAALDCYFSHELGHANDWIEEDLNFEKRVEFLYDVAQQCFKEGSLSTEYVSSIKNKDPQKERYYKTIEYWAEMCQVYFSMPEEFKKANPDEFALVNKYVKMEDPTYDSVAKHTEREDVISQIAEKKG